MKAEALVKRTVQHEVAKPCALQAREKLSLQILANIHDCRLNLSLLHLYVHGKRMELGRKERERRFLF